MECMLYLANDCNLKCSYCYEGKRKNTSKMSLETLDMAWDYIINTNKDDYIDLSLLGGEPLLNKDVFFAIVEKIKNSKVTVNTSITTNGTLFDRRIIETFKENKFNISISIDGDKHTHNLNRISKNGKDLYGEILCSIDCLLENNIDFNVRMTVTCNNVYKLYSNILYFFEKGIRKLYIAFNEFEIWNDEYLKILNDQLDLIDLWYLKKSQEVVINLYDHKMTQFLAYRDIKYCSAGTCQHIVINSEGHIFPCSYVANTKEWKLGDVCNGFYKNKFLNMVKNNLARERKCDKCKYEFVCMGARCGFKNISLTGKLNLPSKYTCELEKVLYEHNDFVFRSMYKNKDAKFMNLYNYAINNNIELTDWMKEVEVEYERKSN